jgi:hypothetical protein
MRRYLHVVCLTWSTLAQAQSDPTVTPDSAQGVSRDISDLSLDQLLGNASRPRLSFNFFGDVSATASNVDGEHPGFELGEPSMLVTADLGSRVRSLMEIAYGPEDSLVDIERFQVGWTGKSFSVLVGRIHSPLGYWNQRYHHGHWLMPTISRPRILAFEDEGGLYPVHQVGVFGGWQTEVAEGVVHLDAGVANGRGALATDVQTGGDANLAKSGVLTAYATDVLTKGLRVGAGFVIDKIPPQNAMIRPALPNIAITEWIGNVHVVYQLEELLVIAEGYALAHRATGLRASFLHAYALVGYRFGRTTPYVREEVFDPSGPQDPFYTPDPMAPDAVLLHGFSETIVGARYNVSQWSALKAEYRLEAPLESGYSTIHRGLINWSFGL